MRKTPQERFWSRVDRSGSCWVWLGGKQSNGYGKFDANGKQWLAHRFAWVESHGSIPVGLTIDHLCRNRMCVRLGHMELVSNKVNVLRGDGLSAQNAKKTNCCHGHAFTPEDTGWWRGERRCLRCCYIRGRSRYVSHYKMERIR